MGRLRAEDVVEDLNVYPLAVWALAAVAALTMVLAVVARRIDSAPSGAYLPILLIPFAFAPFSVLFAQRVRCSPTLLRTRRFYACVDKAPGQWFTLWGDIDLTRLEYAGPNAGIVPSLEFRDSDGNVGHLMLLPGWRRLNEWGPLVVAAADRNGVELDTRTRRYLGGDESALHPKWDGTPIPHYL